MIPEGTRPLLELRNEVGVETLWRQLESGALVALHLDSRSGFLRAIDREQWRRAVDGMNYDWRRDAPRRSALDLLTAGNLSWLYSGSGMGRHQVGADPVLVRAEQSRAGNRAPAETACRNWLEDAMRANPNGTEKPKPEWLNDAQSMFSGLSKRSFDRAWADVIVKTGASAWGRAGRKK